MAFLAVEERLPWKLSIWKEKLLSWYCGHRCEVCALIVV